MSKNQMIDDDLNEKVDYLEVDHEIPGQNYVCLSFISPEKVLKQKERFMTLHFIKWLLHSENCEDPKGKAGFEHFEKLRQRGDSLAYSEVEDVFEDFRISHEEDLNKQFAHENDFQTSVRGVKVRGTYNTLKEAKVRSQVIRRRDPNFNVFIGQVGYWLPWDPDCHQIEDVEYQEQHLNQLMKNYSENVRHRDEIYEEQKTDRLESIKKNVNKQKDKQEDDVKKKIDELREIADAKENVFSAESSEKSKGNMSKPVASSTLGTTSSGKKDSNVLDNSSHADPWMEAKARSSNGSNSSIKGENAMDAKDYVESTKLE